MHFIAKRTTEKAAMSGATVWMFDRANEIMALYRVSCKLQNKSTEAIKNELYHDIAVLIHNDTIRQA
jgi:hypothetical protein